LNIKLCSKQYNKKFVLHLIVAPQLGWRHNYSTKTRQAGRANEQSMYSLMSMVQTYLKNRKPRICLETALEGKCKVPKNPLFKKPASGTVGKSFARFLTWLHELFPNVIIPSVIFLKLRNNPGPNVIKLLTAVIYECS
jgi:hypothetical protein